MFRKKGSVPFFLYSISNQYKKLCMFEVETTDLLAMVVEEEKC